MYSYLSHIDWVVFREKMKASLMTTAMLLCAGVSAYATYIGFSMQIEKDLAVMFAVASCVVMLFAAYLAGWIVQSSYSKKMKGVVLFIVLGAVFSFSTLWSIVGMAKNEVFRIDTASNINTFVAEYSNTGYPQQYASAVTVVEQTEQSIRRVADNSSKGMYTGISGKGTLYNSMILVAEKLGQAKRVLGDSKELVAKYNASIRSNLSVIQDNLEAIDRKQFSQRVGAINEALASLKQVQGSTLLTESIVSLDSIINTIRSLKESQRASGKKTAILEAELQSLESNRDRMKNLAETIKVTMTALSFSPVTEPPIIQCFRHFKYTFHWWALSIALDIVPVWLMVALMQMAHKNKRIL